MHVFVLSDDQAAAEQLRAALSECDVVCPINQVVPLDSASEVAELADLTFLFLAGDDRSLEVLNDLCGRATGHVVAIGTARDPKYILRVVHAGPSDYLDIDGDLATDLRRALGRIREAAPNRAAGGRLISVFSHCGGSGCSLLAANLAVALVEAHKSCLLCDFNFRRGDLSALLNLKPTFSVNDVAKNLGKQRDVLERALTPHDSGLQLLAAPTSLSDVRPIPVDAMRQIVGLARSSFPFTVADLEDFFHPEQSEILKQSDHALFVLRLDYTAMRNARRTFEYLQRDGLETNRITVVVNQHGRPRELTATQAEEVLGRKLTHFVPFDQKTAIASVNQGRPLVQGVPKSRMSRALRKLAEELSAAQPASSAVAGQSPAFVAN